MIIASLLGQASFVTSTGFSPADETIIEQAVVLICRHRAEGTPEGQITLGVGGHFDFGLLFEGFTQKAKLFSEAMKRSIGRCSPFTPGIREQLSPGVVAFTVQPGSGAGVFPGALAVDPATLAQTICAQRAAGQPENAIQFALLEAGITLADLQQALALANAQCPAAAAGPAAEEKRSRNIKIAVGVGAGVLVLVGAVVLLR